MTSDEKVENLLFVIWVLEQRHSYWRKVIRETKAELEKLKEEMVDASCRSEREY